MSPIGCASIPGMCRMHMPSLSILLMHVAGACEAGERAAGRVQQSLYGQPAGQLQGQRLPIHVAGVHHGRRALHIYAGCSSPHACLSCACLILSVLLWEKAVFASESELYLPECELSQRDSELCMYKSKPVCMSLDLLA